ncbi:serine carboxypeptidase [Chloropicon primus]|uniref:Carboxypeptidase n=1 Tax=Chloropicon primus TaxID=1764295 RepID=A0A5B8MFK1_9CHLO|nr:serine carboxypeptidase [Chloropicon primus]|eukprot:QDZ19216.1 serine carboxypeptidase [Chloropicon primus]
MKYAKVVALVALLGCVVATSTLAVRTMPNAKYHPSELSSRLYTRNVVENAKAEDPMRVAGYFKLDRTYDAHMFFFHFQSRNDANSEDPLVVWMTGGPGCSSELAVFYENGPFHINDDLSLNETEFGWDVHHNMIFVDQPINTGFSYSQDDRDEVYTEKTVAADMVDFLTEFLAAYPQYADRDLFITGESYAGHYVPAVTHGIWMANKNGGKQLNLKGFAIGNGLTDPFYQYAQYGNFSLQNNLIDESVFEMTQKQLPECQEKIHDCYMQQDDNTCMGAVDFCQSAIVETILTAAGDINVYDIRKQCGDNPLCYDFSNLSKYLAQPSILKMLGVPSFVHWESCSGKVHTDFMHDWMLQYESIIPPMLEDGVRGMIYAGVEDFICNWLGNFAWVQKMNWNGQLGFNSQPLKPWSSPDGTSQAGEVKAYGPLSFVKVFAAGHMVPMDEPANALKMITSFTRNQPLA